MSPQQSGLSMKNCEITLTSIAKTDVYENAMLFDLASGDWVEAQDHQSINSLTQAEKVRIFLMKNKIYKKVYHLKD